MSEPNETLAVEIGGGVASLRLDRPYAMNALSPQLLSALAEALEGLLERPEVRIIVLEGVGRAFSVGVDLRAMSEFLDARGRLDVDAVQENAALGGRVIDALRRQRAVTVASAHTFAVGGGFLLLAACDLRIATNDIVCALPEVDLGLPLMWGGVPLLVTELGAGLARDLILTGRRFGREELLKGDFIHRWTELEERDRVTGDLVATLLDKPAEALRQMKGQLQDATEVATPHTMPAPERLQLCATDPEFLPTLGAYLERLKG